MVPQLVSDPAQPSELKPATQGSKFCCSPSSIGAEVANGHVESALTPYDDVVYNGMHLNSM